MGRQYFRAAVLAAALTAFTGAAAAQVATPAPSGDVIQTAQIGQPVLSEAPTVSVPAMQFGYAQIDASILYRRLKFPAQTVRVLKADDSWVYGVTNQVAACTYNWAREEGCAQSVVGVAVSRDGSSFRTFDADQLSANRKITLAVWKPTAPVETRIFLAQVPDPRAAATQLVFLGKDAKGLTFELRRASQTGAASPEVQRLVLSPNEEHVIGVLSARLQVLSTDDFSISYRVLHGFS